jgi:SAM-dependent methyltransferase
MGIAAADQRSPKSACFLCDKASETVIWQEEGIEGLLCDCGMVYTNQFTCLTRPEPTREYHPQHFYALPAAFKSSWVARHCPRGRLLDVGCGAGFFLAAVREHGYAVLGLEPSPAYDQELEKRGLTVVHEYVEETSLPPHSFDVVYHCDLLAHFPDPIRCLSAMCELLSPEGVLCFEVGLLGGISPYWYSLIGRIGLGQHLWLYSDLAFKRLMRKAGLEIVHVQYFGLSAQVLGTRIFGALNKRLIAPAWQAVSRNGRERAVAAQQSLINLLRYRVGSILPGVGPQTLLVVAKPEHVQ